MRDKPAVLHLIFSREQSSKAGSVQCVHQGVSGQANAALVQAGLRVGGGRLGRKQADNARASPLP